MNVSQVMQLNSRATNKKLPWFVFVFITVVFFMTTHQWNRPLQQQDDSVREKRIRRVEGVAHGSTERRVVYSLLALYGLTNLMIQRKQKVAIAGLLGWMLVFCVVWAFLSVLWTDDLGLTVRRLVSFSAFCLGALAVATGLSRRYIAMLMCFSSFVFLCLGVLAELSYGTLNVGSSAYRFSGTQHPNSQGLNCFLLVISSLYLGDTSKKGKRFFYVIMFVGLVFLFLTKSRTSVASTLLALFAYKSLTSEFSRRRKGAVGIMVVSLVLFLFVGDILVPSASKMLLLGRDAQEGGETLMGRVYLWQACRGYVGQRPLLGYGFNAFWTPERIEAIQGEQQWALASAHSVYVDVISELGVVGFVLFILSLMLAVARCVAVNMKSADLSYVFLLGFLVFYLSHGFFESIFLHPGHSAFMSLVVLARLGFQNEKHEEKQY